MKRKRARWFQLQQLRILELPCLPNLAELHLMQSVLAITRVLVWSGRLLRKLMMAERPNACDRTTTMGGSI
jgi:hypothetical protein